MSDPSAHRNSHDAAVADAKQMEQELNSYQAKQGLNNNSDSVLESGVNESVEQKFPGASVTYGSAASGAGDNREIPLSEGGDIMPNGKLTKARDFEGEGGPEDKAEIARKDRGGDMDVDSLVRQGGREPTA